jgi:hypothetical protein
MLTRRALLVALLLVLLASVGTTSAECAWVLCNLTAPRTTCATAPRPALSGT